MAAAWVQGSEYEVLFQNKTLPITERGPFKYV